MPQLFSNGARSELASPITASNTSITLKGMGELFPACNYTGNSVLSQTSTENWIKLVIQDDDGFEIVYCYMHEASTNVFSNLKRGQEGTSARVFAADSVVGLRPIGGDLQDLVNQTKANTEALVNKADKTGNISGNAGTATKLESGRVISISGGATATGKIFDGSAAVDLVVTGLNMGNATEGTLAVARGGTGTKTSTGSGSVVLSASPTFTDNPTAPTPESTDNSTRLQTTGGSLLQMQQFGLGVTVFPKTLTNLDTTDIPSGFYRSTPETAGVKPVGVPPNAVVEVIRFNNLDCRQIYYGVGSSVAGRGIWSRHITWNGTVSLPTPWIEQQSVDGSLAQMQNFGVGTVAGAPYTPNLLTHTTGGLFTADATVSAAAGLPLSTLQHSIQYTPGVNAATGALEATALTGTVANAYRKWLNKRNGGALLGWKEYAFLDSPAFTGTPTAPNLKFGNTASADVQTLDYYEEGSFTPILAGVTTAGTFTYTNQVGKYTRIGNKVFWSVRLSISALSGAVGGLRLSGMPFTSSSSSGNAGGINVGFFGGIGAVGLTGIHGLHNGGTATIALYKYVAGTSAAVNLLPEDITSAFQIYTSGFFTVD